MNAPAGVWGKKPENTLPMHKLLISVCLALGLWPQVLLAQSLNVATVTRPPFSFVEDGTETGFSIDLLSALADKLGWTYSLDRKDRFSDMLTAVIDGEADMAIANISITAARE